MAGRAKKLAVAVARMPPRRQERRKTRRNARCQARGGLGCSQLQGWRLGQMGCRVEQLRPSGFLTKSAMAAAGMAPRPQGRRKASRQARCQARSGLGCSQLQGWRSGQRGCWVAHQCSTGRGKVGVATAATEKTRCVPPPKQMHDPAGSPAFPGSWGVPGADAAALPVHARSRTSHPMGQEAGQGVS